MLNALKILFAIYALRAAFVGIQNAIRFPTPRMWLWTAFGVCLLPVAWGLIREKKWAWNAAAGLTIFQLIWGVGQRATMFLSNVVDTSNVMAASFRQVATALAIFVVIFGLLIPARRAYRTSFALSANEGELPVKANSYVKPVALGVLFLLSGLLMLLHPISSPYSPMPLRILGVILVCILWTGAAMSLFERKAKLIRAGTIFVMVIAVGGLLGSLTFYTYFAIAGLIVSAVQLAFGIAAIPTACKARLSFID